MVSGAPCSSNTLRPPEIKLIAHEDFGALELLWCGLSLGIARQRTKFVKHIDYHAPILAELRKLIRIKKEHDTVGYVCEKEW